MLFGMVGQVGWWMTFLMVGWESPTGMGIFVFGSGKSANDNVWEECVWM